MNYELGVMNYEWGRELFVLLCVTQCNLCVTPDSLCVTLCNKKNVIEKR